MYPPPKNIHSSWHPFPHWGLIEPARKKLVYKQFSPLNPHQVFRGFKEVPLSKLNVVILGQDPYPDIRNACGLAFAIPDEDREFDKWPVSLKIIAKALGSFLQQNHACLNINVENIGNFLSPDLFLWETEGIMLLNAAFTCQIGKPGSHYEDWKPLTAALIKWINEVREKVIFWFIGKKQVENFAYFVDTEKNYLFTSIHPGALRYNPDRKFDDKFEEIDNLYKKIHGRYPDWVLPF